MKQIYLILVVCFVLLGSSFLYLLIQQQGQKRSADSNNITTHEPDKKLVEAHANAMKRSQELDLQLGKQLHIVQELRKQNEQLQKQLEESKANSGDKSKLEPPVVQIRPQQPITKENGNSKPRVKLVAAIPTVTRRNNPDYLDKTLAALLSQIDPRIVSETTNFRQEDLEPEKLHNVFVVVMNMKRFDFDSPNESYERCKSKYAHLTKIIKFIDNRKDHDIQTEHEGANAAGLRRTSLTPAVKHQTLDLVDLVRMSLDVVDANYFMFMEDDMTLCPNGITALDHLLAKSNLYFGDQWVYARVGYGMNGIIIRGKQDALTFADYLEKHFSRRPPDHLITEWGAGETAESKNYVGNKKLVGYRYCLFSHIGQTSSLRSEAAWSFPGCYEELVFPITFEVEAFNPKQCPDDDVWPCDVSEDKRQVFKWIKLR